MKTTSKLDLSFGIFTKGSSFELCSSS